MTVETHEDPSCGVCGGMHAVRCDLKYAEVLSEMNWEPMQGGQDERLLAEFS